MLLSVFTPTHNPRHILDAYRSVARQPVSWEMVVVPNGACQPHHLPRELHDDSRVRIVPWQLPEKWDGPIGVGALKQFACTHCRGDIFVELDHDDQLAPGVLADVHRKAEQGAGFIYSDAANYRVVDDQPTPVRYDQRHGWESYDLTLDGVSYTAHRNFAVTARSLCEIYYAPDHVRCWTRDAYYRVGGHNSSLTIGDDQELMIRTYLAGVEFAYTGTCGYLYRRHDQNTSVQQQRELIQQQNRTRNRYLYRLLEEWRRRHSFDYLDVDLRTESDQYTLREGRLQLTAADNSVGVIRAYDVLQYVPPEQIVPTLNELYRVLVPGGWLSLAVPSTDGRGAFMPYYRSQWNEYMFLYFCEDEHRRHYSERMPNGPLDARFQPVRLFTAFPATAGMPRPYGTYERAKVSYAYADLCALKGQRQPGLVEV
jgi:predicted SAM-dependent methyltransferase